MKGPIERAWEILKFNRQKSSEPQQPVTKAEDKIWMPPVSQQSVGEQLDKFFGGHD